LRKKK